MQDGGEEDGRGAGVGGGGEFPGPDGAGDMAGAAIARPGGRPSRSLPDGSLPEIIRRALRAASKLVPDREQAILAATVDLLAESGYEALRLDAVASRAGASKATLYRHWSGKAELVVDAVRRYGQAELAEAPDTGSLRGDLLATLACIRDLLSGKTGNLMAGLLAALQKNAELAQVVRASMFEDQQGFIRKLLDRAVARGELPGGGDPNVVPEVATAIMFTRLFLNGRPVDDKFLAHLTDDILTPLLARPR